MKALTSIVLIVHLGTSTELFGQESSPKNHLEFNLIWPLVPKIYQLKYGHEVAQFQNGMKGEFIASINYRPRTLAENEGDKTMFAIAPGYRHYWWKGFNTELSIYPEFVSINNNVVDGQDYKDFYIVPEFYTGYKGYFLKEKWFYNVQLGFGKIIFPDESYPRAEEGKLFYNGNLTVGYSF